MGVRRRGLGVQRRSNLDYVASIVGGISRVISYRATPIRVSTYRSIVGRLTKLSSLQLRAEVAVIVWGEIYSILIGESVTDARSLRDVSGEGLLVLNNQSAA